MSKSDADDLGGVSKVWIQRAEGVRSLTIPTPRTKEAQGMGRRTVGRRAARVAAQAVIVAVLVAGSATPAVAAKPAGHGGGGGGGTATPTGNDVSYPQ